MVIPYALDILTCTAKCTHDHKRRQRNLAENGGWVDKKKTGNFAVSGDFIATVEIFYMPQTCDKGQTVLISLR
jgi:hypothetical protein